MKKPDTSSKDMWELLLKALASEKEEYKFQQALNQLSEKKIKSFLESTYGEFSDTPMHAAALSDKPSICDILLKYFNLFEVDAKNKLGLSPLEGMFYKIEGVGHNPFKIGNKLIRHGALRSDNFKKYLKQYTPFTEEDFPPIQVHLKNLKGDTPFIEKTFQKVLLQIALDSIKSFKENHISTIEASDISTVEASGDFNITDGGGKQIPNKEGASLDDASTEISKLLSQFLNLVSELNSSAKNEKVKKGILDLLEQEKVLDLVIGGVKKIRGGEKLSTSDKFSHGKETLSFVDLAKRCCFLSTDAKDKRKSMEDALGVKFELKPSKKVKTSKSETEKVGGDKNKKGWGKEDPGMY